MVWIKCIASFFGVLLGGVVTMVAFALSGASKETSVVVFFVVTCILYWWWYHSFFGKGKPLHKYSKARKKDEDFTPFSKYDPVERRFRLVGTNHEGRKQYILDHKEEIEDEGISFSREHALDKDPNAIAVLHNGHVLGFIAAEYAAILAPFFDAHREDIRYTFSIWVGRSGQLVGFYIRLSVSKHATKGEFKALIEQCKELAYTS